MPGLELKIPPVAVGLIAALSMWLVSAYAPTLVLAIPWRVALAAVLAVLGFAFATAGIFAFRKAKTTVNPMKPETASAVVASGVYRFSRNPMYAGVLVMLGGWAVFLDQALPFFFLPAFVLYMTIFQIRPEERALSAQFGSAYTDYMRTVRRWL